VIRTTLRVKHSMTSASGTSVEQRAKNGWGKVVDAFRGTLKGHTAVANDREWPAWTEEHLPELKRKYVHGQGLLYQFLVFGFVVGLAAHVGGYVLLASAPSGMLGLIADLLHALGGSLWTGIVVVLFVQVIPELKRRQIKQAVDAYEARRRDGGANSATMTSNAA
jgi:hypothetical protein